MQVPVLLNLMIYSFNLSLITRKRTFELLNSKFIWNYFLLATNSISVGILTIAAAEPSKLL